MKPPVFDYICPATIEEVVEILRVSGDSVKLIAGGQSLMPALNFRLSAPSALVDLGAIDSLNEIREDKDNWILGAMVTHRRVETEPWIKKALPLLSHAMRHVAHVQIRNRGTIGGSLCHSDPSAEWPGLCVACDAIMVVVGPAGTKHVAARDFVQGMYTTVIGSQDLLLEIRFPRWPLSRRWGFSEISRRSGDFAVAGAAAVGDFDERGTCRFLRLAVFGATDKPEQINVDGLLAIEAVGPTQITEAADMAASSLLVRGDHHASEAYRAEVVRHVVAAVLQQVFEQE